MRAKIVRSILVACILLAGFGLSLEYRDKGEGLGGLVVYASTGVYLLTLRIITWLRKGKST